MKQNVKNGDIRRMQIAISLGLFCWLGCPVFADNSDKSLDQAITPNQAVQFLLKDLSSSNKQSSVVSEKIILSKFEHVRELAGQDKDLVLQLLYFDSQARTEKERWLTMAIVKYLGISNETFAEVGLDLLVFENEPINKMAFACLTRADRTPQGDVDFSRYENILREKKGNIAQGLIRYMYWRNPQAAVLSMARIYGDKNIETNLVDQLKGDKKMVLPSLAVRSEWWVRLYVAEMMGKHPQLRDPVILKKLEQDTDPLVREKASKLKAELQSK